VLGASHEDYGALMLRRFERAGNGPFRFSLSLKIIVFRYLDLP
jgi:hypothetical protein